MNEEIKEILEHIKLYSEKIYCLSEKEKIIILDYITNLQQENKRLKEKLEEHDETLEKTFNLVAQLTLRIDKAIEYINKKDEWVKNSDYRLLKTEDLLNILQNGGEK